MAFDKAHVVFPGDIRYAVANDKQTSIETLEMILNNEDRSEWTGEDYLDFENDDWTDDVDQVVDYRRDVMNEIIERCREAAKNEINSRNGKNT